MQAMSHLPAMYPASAEVEPLWHVATSRGIVSVNLRQLEDAMQKGHLDESTLVTRTGMPTWYTLGVLAGPDYRRRRVSTAEACVATSERAAASPPRSVHSWTSGLIVGAIIGLVLLGGLALGPRMPGGYPALAVAASASVARHMTTLRERVRDLVQQTVASNGRSERR